MVYGLSLFTEKKYCYSQRGTVLKQQILFFLSKRINHHVWLDIAFHKLQQWNDSLTIKIHLATWVVLSKRIKHFSLLFPHHFNCSQSFWLSLLLRIINTEPLRNILKGSEVEKEIVKIHHKMHQRNYFLQGTSTGPKAQFQLYFLTKIKMNENFAVSFPLNCTLAAKEPGWLSPDYHSSVAMIWFFISWWSLIQFSLKPATKNMRADTTQSLNCKTS